MPTARFCDQSFYAKFFCIRMFKCQRFWWLYILGIVKSLFPSELSHLFQTWYALVISVGFISSTPVNSLELVQNCTHIDCDHSRDSLILFILLPLLMMGTGKLPKSVEIKILKAKRAGIYWSFYWNNYLASIFLYFGCQDLGR